jgi:hypothetical protein
MISGDILRFDDISNNDFSPAIESGQTRKRNRMTQGF